MELLHPFCVSQNVLEAIGMITKTKKSIRWKGWPTVGAQGGEMDPGMGGLIGASVQQPFWLERAMLSVAQRCSHD